jgi:hypothetical protein
MKSIEDRLLQQSQRRGDCLVWTGSLTYSGYGRIQISAGGNTGAHRVAYQVWVGPIPDGMQIDHLCRVRNCIEPTHLEVVTSRGRFDQGDRAMSGDVERVAEVASRVLLDEGAGPGNSIHSWRCEYPDRYGPCDCVGEVAQELAQTLLAPGGVVAGMVAEAWAGAADEPGEVNAVPTPGQLLRRLADADADQRLAWASRALANADMASACFVHNHVGRIASLERQLRDAQGEAADLRARVLAIEPVAYRNDSSNGGEWVAAVPVEQLRAAVAAEPAETGPGRRSAGSEGCREGDSTSRGSENGSQGDSEPVCGAGVGGGEVCYRREGHDGPHDPDSTEVAK